MSKKNSKKIETAEITTTTAEITADQLASLLAEQKRISAQLKLHRAEINEKNQAEANERKEKRINNFTTWNIQRVKHYQKGMNCLRSDYLIEYSVDVKRVDEVRLSAELGNMYQLGGTIRIIGKKPVAAVKKVETTATV